MCVAKTRLTAPHNSSHDSSTNRAAPKSAVPDWETRRTQPLAPIAPPPYVSELKHTEPQKRTDLPMNLYRVDDQNGICVIVVASDEDEALKIAKRKLKTGNGLSELEGHVAETLGDEFQADEAEVEEIDTDEPQMVGGYLY